MDKKTKFTPQWWADGNNHCINCRFFSDKNHSEQICIISGISVSARHIACESFDI